MISSRTVVAIGLGLALCATLPLQAADGNAAGRQAEDADVRGLPRHPGYRTAYPVVYSVPKLGGQNAGYIVKALQDYRSGARKHPSMDAMAGSLSDQDMADLAAYYAGGK